MTAHDVNTRGYRYPLLLAGCTGCQACAQICPDFVFQVYKYDTAARDHRATAVTRGRDRDACALLEGSEAIAEAMVAAGCRFFAGYPMTPFTEVLEHMATQAARRSAACA